MSHELMVQPPFREDWTDVTIEGEHEDEVLSILVSRLIAAEYEVLIEDEDGDMIPAEEYERGQE
jgi:hypothetical protein